ncbi:hypothetical protein GIB67_035480 [Kingdonia uniflora]|uniref:FAR1 domain-containing protein n=1 Tax=Kingdonia uniflora TaxID=39325 RepID=A0A7J7P0G3_9MAGN|nr:hypothetical protein GIB67_035480 [Kingdonia uniflora]
MVYEGMVCDSEEDAFKKYNDFTRKVGFNVRKDKIYKRADGSIRNRMFVCFKQGLRKENKRCKNTTKVRNESRTDYKARMIIKMRRMNGLLLRLSMSITMFCRPHPRLICCAHKEK